MMMNEMITTADNNYWMNHVSKQDTEDETGHLKWMMSNIFFSGYHNRRKFRSETSDNMDS